MVVVLDNLTQIKLMLIEEAPAIPVDSNNGNRNTGILRYLPI
jgi:hypothetical protein